MQAYIPVGSQCNALLLTSYRCVHLDLIRATVHLNRLPLRPHLLTSCTCASLSLQLSVLCYLITKFRTCCCTDHGLPAVKRHLTALEHLQQALCSIGDGNADLATRISTSPNYCVPNTDSRLHFLLICKCGQPIDHHNQTTKVRLPRKVNHPSSCRLHREAQRGTRPVQLDMLLGSACNQAAI